VNETQQQQYEPGLYQYDGSAFRKLEPSGEVKIPVSPEAETAVKATRKAAQGVIGMRPELSLVASAMILEAAKMPTIAECVKAYGQRIYNGADTSAVKQSTAGESAHDSLQQVVTASPETSAAPATETPAAAEAVPEVTPLAEAQAKPEQQSASAYL